MTEPKPPKTIFDLVDDPSPTSALANGMTLEEALAQVDERRGGDEELKQILRDCYNLPPHPPTK